MADPGPADPRPDAAPEAQPRNAAPFVETPDDVIAEALALAGVGAADVVVDLGCGDGRLCVAAARDCGARSVGVDIDEALLAQFRAAAAAQGVQARVEARAGDLFAAGSAAELGAMGATVVFLYLLPPAVRRLERALREWLGAAPGRRVVCAWYPLRSVEPAARVTCGELGNVTLSLFTAASLERPADGWTSASPSSSDDDEPELRADVAAMLREQKSRRPMRISRALRSARAAPATSLDVPLPGLPSLKPGRELAAPETLVTTLSNGVRVATRETYGLTSTAGVFVDGGSQLETAATRGAAHLWAATAFGSSASRPAGDLVGRLEQLGATPGANAGRDHAVVSVDVLRDAVPEAFALMVEPIVDPLDDADELAQAAQVMAFQAEDARFSLATVMVDEVLDAGYGHEAVGFSPMQLWELDAPLRLAPEQRQALLAGWRAQNLVGERVVVTGAGVDHAQLVALAERHLGALPRGAPAPVGLPVAYRGGNVRVEVPEAELAHLAVAFEASGWRGDDMIATCVMQTLLGGGDSFSAGGPGKGMYTRLYQEVLSSYAWVESCSGLSSMVRDCGVVGIQGACQPQYAPTLAAIMLQHLIRLSQEPVGAERLGRARNQLKSAVLMNLESRLVLFEDLGRQLITYDRYLDPADVCARIDAVSADDLLRVARRALRSPPAVVALGKTEGAPDAASVAEYIKAYQGRTGATFA